MISPPIEWPTSAMRRTSTGQDCDQAVEQRRQRDAVLGDRQAGVDAQEDRRPALVGEPVAVAALVRRLAPASVLGRAARFQ